MPVERHGAGLRADIDDLAATLLDHPGRKGLGEEKRCAQIDRHDAIPALHLGFEDALDRGNPGVVDENVDDAPSLERGARRGLWALYRGKIGLDNEAAAAVRPNHVF